MTEVRTRVTMHADRQRADHPDAKRLNERCVLERHEPGCASQTSVAMRPVRASRR